MFNNIIITLEKIKTIICVALCMVFLFSVDSDGDGYSDELELELETNPNSKEDRYYYGSWPYNPMKDKILGINIPIQCPGNISCECQTNEDCVNNNCKPTVHGEYFCYPKIGDIFPHFIAVDQHGESVDIYDFAMQGKIIAIEFGTAWCAPCQHLSNWLSSGNEKIKSLRMWKKEYDIIREKVDKGEVVFITILYQGKLKSEAASYETVSDWHNQFPHDKMPNLADEYADIHRWIKPTGFPCVNLLDENMRLLTTSTRGFTEAFDILSGLRPIPTAD